MRWIDYFFKQKIFESQESSFSQMLLLKMNQSQKNRRLKLGNRKSNGSISYFWVVFFLLQTIPSVRISKCQAYRWSEKERDCYFKRNIYREMYHMLIPSKCSKCSKWINDVTRNTSFSAETFNQNVRFWRKAVSKGRKERKQWLVVQGAIWCMNVATQ